LAILLLLTLRKSTSSPSISTAGSVSAIHPCSASFIAHDLVDETVPLLYDEAIHVFSKEIGQLKEWKQFEALDLSSKLVHYISNRILVGPDLCRRQDYRATTERLNMSHVIFGALWNFIPLGPFRKPFYRVFSIPYRAQIRCAMNKYLIPIIEERMSRENKSESEKNLDTIQLMIDMLPASPNEVDSF
jgi:hypothetical protein